MKKIKKVLKKIKAVKSAKKPAVKAVKKSVKKAAVKSAVKKVAPAKPVFKAVAKQEPKLNAKEIAAVKKELSRILDEVKKRLQEKKSMDMPEPEVGDPIDQALQSLDKELLFEVTDNDQRMIEQIESALRRIEKGVYGICESCRCVIPQKRLKTVPFARYCVHCQNSSETFVPMSE